MQRGVVSKTNWKCLDRSAVALWLLCQRSAKRYRCSVLPAEDAVWAQWCSASAPSDPGCDKQSMRRMRLGCPATKRESDRAFFRAG